VLVDVVVVAVVVVVVAPQLAQQFVAPGSTVPPLLLHHLASWSPWHTPSGVVQMTSPELPQVEFDMQERIADWH